MSHSRGRPSAADPRVRARSRGQELGRRLGCCGRAAVGGALLEQGTALFPGIGVALKGYEAAGALLEGEPDEAIEVAASMVPGGTVALGIVRESAKVLGV